MDERTAAWISWGGGGIILLAAAAGFVLHLAYGESVFVARLIAGAATCL